MKKTTDKNPVGRPPIGPQITLRVPVAMLKAIAGALAEGEDRASFIRAAIDRELARRRRPRSGR